MQAEKYMAFKGWKNAYNDKAYENIYNRERVSKKLKINLPPRLKGTNVKNTL